MPKPTPMRKTEPASGETETMRFQPADAWSLGREILAMPGVTGVWILQPSDLDLMMWVTVRGFDERAFYDRQAVYMAIHRFIDEHLEALRASEFAFDHSVLVDDPELGDPLIPDEAEPVAA